MPFLLLLCFLVGSSALVAQNREDPDAAEPERAIAVHYLEIVTPDPEGTCEALAKLHGVTFGDGLRCADGQVVRLGVEIPDELGGATWGPGLAAEGGWVPGESRYLQAWYRDPSGPCGVGFNLTHALELAVAP